MSAAGVRSVGSCTAPLGLGASFVRIPNSNAVLSVTTVSERYGVQLLRP